MYRVYHDFSKRIDSPIPGMVAAPLVCRGTHEDLQRLNITLADGMRVLLYQPDGSPQHPQDQLEVSATIRYDKTQGFFCADFAYEELMYQRERATEPPNLSARANAHHPSASAHDSRI